MATGCSRLPQQFFNVPCVDLARGLLGQRLVRRAGGGGPRLSGVVVETEAYLGGDDLASHSYNGRRTERNEAMFMAAGTAYVYSVYGMHFCLNVSSAGDGAAVLVRALQPAEGLPHMAANRRIVCAHSRLKEADAGAVPAVDVCYTCSRGLCSGPAKLCQALQIDKALFNKTDLCASGSDLWLEPGESVADDQIVAASRIGVDYAGPMWASKPLRFYVKDSCFVSKFVRSRAVVAEPSALECHVVTGAQ